MECQPLQIKRRSEWSALEPTSKAKLLKRPAKKVIIIHTNTEFSCSTDVNMFLVRYLQTLHMNIRNENDIFYNFLIGGDGVVYEGRGWNEKGSHTPGHDHDSIGIAFIGNFNKIVPCEMMLNSLKMLIGEGLKLKKIDEDYNIFGQGIFIGTNSPGEKLNDIMKNWVTYLDTY